jgi:hypothetical protein
MSASLREKTLALGSGDKGAAADFDQLNLARFG